MTVFILIALTAWLAWGNGANDNFKGVATLYGSGTAGYRKSLALATVAQVAGSVASVLLAAKLVRAFSGEGLVPESLLGTAPLLTAVAAAAAATVFLATRLGMPTSTTHALAGALLGVALVASPEGISRWAFFTQKMAAPLLLSPLAAIALTAALYTLLHRARRACGVAHDACVCFEPAILVAEPAASGAAAAIAIAAPSLRVGDTASCGLRYGGHVLGFRVQPTVDAVHSLSGAAVCFARGVNDTPKIAALLLAFGAVNHRVALGLMAAAMAAGGLVQARRVAETMSRKITNLNTGQGLCANLVTSALVLVASRFGMPVSTTHVSTGAIFGIGIVRRRARLRVIGAILAAWLLTLPLAAALGALIFTITRAMGG